MAKLQTNQKKKKDNRTNTHGNKIKWLPDDHQRAAAESDSRGIFNGYAKRGSVTWIIPHDTADRGGYNMYTYVLAIL